MITPRKIRVLIVDDSAVVRRAIADALSADPEIEVVGTACDPYLARDKILELNPDVLTLDIEMPRMDGLTFLRILQQHHPMPVIIISSVTQAGSAAALEALASGAVDVIPKPSSSWSIGSMRAHLPGRIKAASVARLKNCGPAAIPSAPPAPSSSHLSFHPRQLLVIGASTGGTEAIKSVLCQLPPGLPGICIVQHIPPLFSKAFAERLAQCCAFEVREAVYGDEVRRGLALVAPGDHHMLVCLDGGRYRVRLNQSPPLHHVRPAVDLLFDSAAACAGRYAVGALLTGMGSDGAEGMLKLKNAGATTVAQDEQSCVVYGMPKAAVQMGAVEQVLPLGRIPHAIHQALLARAAGPATSKSDSGADCASPQRSVQAEFSDDHKTHQPCKR
jgi:two-component system chemotaxis response regulator CheB